MGKLNCNMKKAMVLTLLFICVMALLVGCSKGTKNLLTEKLEYQEIDEIQVITAMGNPKYGADSKTIMDKNEMKMFIDTFNGAIIGDKVKDTYLSVGMSIIL